MFAPRCHFSIGPGRRLISWGLALAATWVVRAEITLAPLFQDHMVLQRDRAVPVWGNGEPGEAVAVRFGAAHVTTTVASSGKWNVSLPPQGATANPAELAVEGRNRLVVRDVVVGDVWLCAGQSNMQMAARTAQDFERERADAHFPSIRHFKVSPRFSDTPQTTAEGAWKVCTPDTVGDFSAVAFYFARTVGREVGVPIGVINASYGNSPIASWRSAAGLRDEPVVSTWWRDQQRASTPPRPHRQPSSCYNGMVHPLVPYGVRGVLWYQGESDATEAVTLAPVYARQFAGLIREWRKDFRQGDLPFLWVQLAGYGKAGDRAWVAVREAQEAALELPATGQAIAIDIGDANDIHPKNKQEVGGRLALLALRRVYERAVEDLGPTPAGMTTQADALRLQFQHAPGGLVVRGDLAAGFELAGKDGKFHPVTAARIETQGGREVVELRASGVAAPVAVRYAWRSAPATPLFNRTGLPAGPFQREVR